MKGKIEVYILVPMGKGDHVLGQPGPDSYSVVSTQPFLGWVWALDSSSRFGVDWSLI